jgi:hypothetical protein
MTEPCKDDTKKPLKRPKKQTVLNRSRDTILYSPYRGRISKDDTYFFRKA